MSFLNLGSDLSWMRFTRFLKFSLVAFALNSVWVLVLNLIPLQADASSMKQWPKTGFIDLQAVASSDDGDRNRGFSLNDAALYFSKDYSRASAYIDLPFQTNVVDTAARFTFTENKAQAFLTYPLGKSMSLTFGQYDSFLGYEARDSRERFFADPGFIIQFMNLPQTHTGLQFTYKAAQLTAQAQVANPNGNYQMFNQSPEIGGKIALNSGDFFGSAAFTIGEARTGADRTSTVFDFMGGVLLGKLRIDGELVLRKPSFSSEQITGIGVFGNYSMDERLDLGGRMEFIQKPVANVDRALTFSVGPSYQIESGLLGRADFSLANLSMTGGGSETDYHISFSVVADF